MPAVMTPYEELMAYADETSAANAGWEGELIDAHLVTQRYGIPTATLSTMQVERRVIFFPDSDGFARFPSEQFVHGGAVPALAALQGMIGDASETWLFLMTPRASTKGCRPIDLLKEGLKDDILAAAERQYGDPWLGFL